MDNDIAGVAHPRRVRRDSDAWGGLSAMDTDRQLREYAELCGPVTVTCAHHRAMLDSHGILRCPCGAANDTVAPLTDADIASAYA